MSRAKLGALTASMLLIALGSPASRTAEAGFGVNLIANPDAEAGGPGPTSDTVVAVPGWTTQGNFTIHQYGDPFYLTTTSPGPSDRGSNFFYGGPANSSSSGSQIIDESSDIATIKTGRVTYDLSGWLGGYDSQGDNAVLTVTFLGTSNTVLGSASIGPVSNTDRDNISGLLFRDTTGDLPAGTLMIDVQLQMTRLQGSDNDGYADNLSFVLHANSVPEPASLIMLGIGSLSLFGYIRRRRPSSPAQNA
jgi:hypothetical protein